MAQNLETGLIIKSLTTDVNALKTENSFSATTFVVNNNGNVGVGVSNPTEKLEISSKTKTQNIQITSGATSAGYLLTLNDTQGNVKWTDYSLISSVSATSPVSASTVGNVVSLSIQNAKADDLTKGVAAFTSSDFNDNNNGLISIDYVNGQSASTSNKGFLSSSDWNVFNNKQNLITLTTTGSLGPATFNQTTGALNIPQYGGVGSAGFGYILLMGFNSTQTVNSSISPDTYVFGPNIDGEWLVLADDRFSRRLRAVKNGSIKTASVMVELASIYAGSTTGATMNLFVRNVTSGTSHTIDSAFPVFSGATNGWSGTPPSRVAFYNFSPPISVSQGDQLQVRFTPRSFSQGWVNNPVISTMIVNLYIE